MEIIDPPQQLQPSRKRKPTEEEARETLQKFILAKKKANMANMEKERTEGSSSSSSSSNINKSNGALSRMGPLQLELPAIQLDHNEMNMRLQALQQQQAQQAARNLSRNQAYLQMVSEEENEPVKLFTLYDIKDDETSKKALDAKRRLRFTNIHGLIMAEEKLFLVTACDHFLACYEELIEYVQAIGELRNKQIIVEHYYYKVYMHTLKMFYYTDKGWRFRVDFDEFFSGFLRRFKEPIINKMRETFNRAKAIRDARRVAVESIVLPQL